jgi:hypothetical protein
MRQRRFFAIVTTLSGVFIVAPNGIAQTPQANRTPVVVELFTSEGCSSCPPADTLLGKLDKLQPVNGVQIIVLGEHVDYWDDGGWHDRFSSHQFTERQNDYGTHFHSPNGIYTPQMVVDGSTQFLGSDPSQAIKAITAAARTPKTMLTLTNVAVDGHQVAAAVSAPPSAFKGDLYAALVDATDSTDVKGGENKSRHLEHAGVVRVMQRIGSLKDLEKGPHAFSLTAPSGDPTENMRLVVFAQRDGGPIVGAVSIAVAAAPTPVAAIPQRTDFRTQALP